MLQCDLVIATMYVQCQIGSRTGYCTYVCMYRIIRHLSTGITTPLFVLPGVVGSLHQNWQTSQVRTEHHHHHLCGVCVCASIRPKVAHKHTHKILESRTTSTVIPVTYNIICTWYIPVQNSSFSLA